jgi:hypothetical protein
MSKTALQRWVRKEEDDYPDKQIVLRVWEEGNPYSKAFSCSSFVAVILLTGGQEGRGADTTSYDK